MMFLCAYVVLNEGLKKIFRRHCVRLLLQAPIPTSWTVGALDQLVADPDVSAAVKVAIDDYILQQKAGQQRYQEAVGR